MRYARTHKLTRGADRYPYWSLLFDLKLQCLSQILAPAFLDRRK